jgi:hypothetical protein
MQITLRSGAQIEFEVSEGSGVEFDLETGGVASINVMPAPGSLTQLDFVRVDDVSAIVTRFVPAERPGDAGWLPPR